MCFVLQLLQMIVFCVTIVTDDVFCATIVTDDCVLCYNLQFDEKRHFPRFLMNVLGRIKNVRNNSSDAKTFVFPSFTFNVQGVVINSPDGYISWSDLHSIYDQDSK